MRTIQLARNKGVALIDDEDFDKVSGIAWRKSNNGYAVGFTKGSPKTRKPVLMHRVILNTDKGMWTDHIDGDKLNNQKSNLRMCTPVQNQGNKRTLKKRKDCPYKGVNKITRCSSVPWQAQIGINRKMIFLGRYSTAEEAALAYNDAAKKWFGEFAFLNDIKT